jgi:iron complex outermembrane receptor protein
LKWERLDSHYSASDVTNIGLPTSERDASDSFFSPHFGVKWFPLDWLVFHGNVGRYYRAPSFYELFGDRGSVVGNPALEVETGVHYDIGATITFTKRGYLDKFSTSYTLYYLQLEDLIAFVQNSQRTAKAENIGEAEILGHEFALETSLFRFLNFTANYTYQQALDRSGIPSLNNRPLPGRPRNELHLGLAFLHPRWGKLFYSFDYLDGNYLDRYGYLEVPARSIHNAGITITPTRQLSFTFEVKNIGNEQIYDVMGYPLPGISYFGTVTYKYNYLPAQENRSGENSQTGGEEE